MQANRTNALANATDPTIVLASKASYRKPSANERARGRMVLMLYVNDHR